MSSPLKQSSSPVSRASGESSRRRSSGGLAGMEGYKRDSAAHAARRASIKDQSVGSGGIFASVFNSAFKGDKK